MKKIKLSNGWTINVQYDEKYKGVVVSFDDDDACVFDSAFLDFRGGHYDICFDRSTWTSAPTYSQALSIAIKTIRAHREWKTDEINTLDANLFSIHSKEIEDELQRDLDSEDR